MSTMLLSIKPQYAKVILEGKKRFEFRKSRPKNGVDKIIFYASSPQQEVVGEADIEEILEKYYNSKNFVLSMRYIIFNYYKESPFKFFEEFATYFDKNGYFDVAQGKNQLYKILLDFYNESINMIIYH